MSKNETSDNYDYIIANPDPKTRLIEDITDIQWILQRREGKHWRSHMFFRSRKGLQLYVTLPEELFNRLPERYPEGHHSPAIAP
jgi:hypothetical protein